MHHAGDHACPAGLMAGAEPRSVVAMKVFIERKAISPVRIVLKSFGAAIDGPPAAGVFQEDTREPPRDLLGHLIQVHATSRARRTLDRKIVAVIAVVL